MIRPGSTGSEGELAHDAIRKVKGKAAIKRGICFSLDDDGFPQLVAAAL
jgi:hypothetical protein